MSLDLGTFMVTHKHSFWSWIIIANGNINFEAGAVFENLTKTLAVFLSVVIGLEIAIVVYVYRKIDLFAEGIFNSISM